MFLDLGPVYVEYDPHIHDKENCRFYGAWRTQGDVIYGDATEQICKSYEQAATEAASFNRSLFYQYRLACVKRVLSYLERHEREKGNA